MQYNNPNSLLNSNIYIALGNAHTNIARRPLSKRHCLSFKAKTVEKL